jgi:trehalose-phosphatase
MKLRTTTHRSNPLAAAIGTRLDGSPLAVMLDIDGTLAPIAPRPEDARIPHSTRAVLQRLTALPRVHLALVTGRSAEDAGRMAVDGAWIIGNHGLELQSPAGELTANPDAARHEDAVASAARALALLPDELPGVLLENKRWTLGVHYRLARPEAVTRIHDRITEVARLTGLRITEGKKVFELRPPILSDKGTATMAFLARIGARATDASALFAGDDRTDEDAFRALRAASPRAVTVRVHAEEDAVQETEAELRLSSPEDVRELLEWIADRRGALAR